jgi:hypothetical protein
MPKKPIWMRCAPIASANRSLSIRYVVVVVVVVCLFVYWFVVLVEIGAKARSKENQSIETGLFQIIANETRYHFAEFDL